MGLGIGIGISPILSNTIGSGNPPINTVTPLITGDIGLGGELITTNGTWIGDPVIAYSYQWNRNGTAILGATNSTYTITISDSNKNITCTVTATNAIGSSNATSNAISIPVFSAPSNTVAPAITGTAQEGQVVTCSTGTWTGTSPITYAYQWMRNGSNIGSATNSTYTLVTADVSQSITCQVTATNAVGSTNATSNTITPTSSVDPDAQAFITAASITNPTQQSAINTLVTDLKGYSIWTKMKAIYPIVGGSASNHKFNLKDPRDLDAAFRLTFASGVTHSSTGMTSNGSSGYADTFIRPSINLINNSCHISFYSRTNIATNNWDMGVAEDATSYVAMNIRTSADSFRPFAQDVAITTASNTDSKGLYIANRTGTNAKSGFKNNTKVVTSTVASGFRTNNKIFLLALNFSNTPSSYSTRECAFASIGDGLTDIDASNLYTAVQAFQTTLNRQI